VTVVRLKGLHSATKRLATGKRVTYWYAWRGGPPLPGKPGEPAFMAAYAKALASRKTPKTEDLAALTQRFRASPEWARMAASTRREWGRWLDRLALGELGHYSFDALSDPEVGADILAWRDQWADKPRTADYAMQVVSRLLSWGKARRLIRINAAEGIEKLYQGDRADVIWTEDERASYAMWAPSTEAAFIVDLACLTGLRREDLADLKWSEVGEIYISKTTSKSRHKRTASIPILPETKVLLNKIKDNRPNSEYVLTNTRGRPWTPSGLSHAVSAFGGKRLHDCRGTFATMLRRGGLTGPQIADSMGWEEERVSRLLSVYVDREAIVRDIAERLGRNER